MFLIPVSCFDSQYLSRSNRNEIVNFKNKYVKNKRWEKIQGSGMNEFLFLNELLNVVIIWDRLALTISYK